MTPAPRTDREPADRVGPCEPVDLLVVGAGPAGSAAALTARRHGLDVHLVDKATFPRDKCCGDGLTTSALRLLEDLGVDPRALPSYIQVSDVHLVGPDGKDHCFPLPDGRGAFAAVVRRRELDALLVTAATDAGAVHRPATTLTGLQTDADGVTAELTGADGSTTVTRARFVVAADGMWSTSRKLLGVGPSGYRGSWHAFRQYFRGVGPRAQRDLIVWFEPDLLPGYLWSFPLGDGSANVGFGILRQGRRVRQMGRTWTELLARPQIRDVLGPDAQPEDRHTAWPIPADLGELPLSVGRVLFAGDAAAASDPLTGEGIGQALETGALAASSIAEVGPEQADVAEAYESTLRRGMVRDHALAGLLSKGLGTPRGARLSLGLAGLTPWTRRNFARWLFEDYPRAALTTPHRWHRQMFSSPGAFEHGVSEPSRIEPGAPLSRR